jgi:carboxylate-amine ligase
MFTLGVEEELHLVAPDSLEPELATDAVLAQGDWRAGRAAGEISDGVIELITPVSTRAGEVVATLRELRAEAASRGVALLGAGLHPSAVFGDVRHREGRRYDLIAGSMRGVMRQTPHCGVHVHVGMPDAETAIRACNGMRKWIPLLQALGANSPFWYGQDSGLASARSVICNSFPRAGIPRAFADYEDFEGTVRDFQLVGDCPDYSLIWWDLRPHPRLGTLEIRALDAQSSTDDLAALVALAHCLAVHEAGAPPARDIGPEALRAMSFSANRDGLDARVPFDGAMLPARNAAVLALALVGHHAVELGCWEELMLVQRLLERGNGAMRQRRAAAAAGIPGALRMLAAETLREARPGHRRRDLAIPVAGR